MEVSKKRWYQKTWAIIALLIVFFPAGLFLMWKYTTWSPKIKWIISGIFVFTILINLITGGNKQSTENSSNPTPVATAPTQTQPTETPKPTPQDLDAAVRFSEVAYQITNNENKDWTNCKLEMNSGIFKGGYIYKAEIIPSQDPLIIPFREFTKGDGTRFNPYDIKPQNLSITCQIEGQLRFGHYTIN